MGTDIHPAVEVRRKGVWRYHRPTEPCRWYEEVWTESEVKRLTDNGYVAKYGPLTVGARRNTWDRCKTRLPDFFSERNYRVFAVLGDVRNGSGFAGVYTHDYLPPISSQRGFPGDMDPKTMTRMSHEHSETWVTLAELKAYDYDQDFIEGGVLDEGEYLRCTVTGETPVSWSGGISGKNIVVLSTEDYASLYDSPISLLAETNLAKHRTVKYDRSKSYFIRHAWQRNLRGEVSAIPDEIIPYLEKLVPKGGTDEDVRIVMDFDS